MGYDKKEISVGSNAMTFSSLDVVEVELMSYICVL
jgi:hypothetical protein